MKHGLTKVRSILVAIGLAVALAGCGAANSGGGASPSASPASSSAPAAATPASTQSPAPAGAAQTQYPLKVRDATGKEFTFEKAPQRIVSVSPAETETLFALGLGDRIVGVSDYDDYPAEALSKPKMGSIVQPNVESLIAAKPDIVFTGVSMTSESVEKLRNLGVNVFKVEPKTLDDVMNNILLIGQIADVQPAAEKVVTEMKQERQLVTDAVKQVKPEEKKRVYLEFSPGWTVGKGEFLDELVTLAGGVNIAAEAGITGWREINEEMVIKSNPQVILYSKDIVDDKSKKTLEQLIRGRSGWDKIDAVASNRLYGLDTNLISRPGPRLAQGLHEIAKAIYPDLVK